MITKYGETKPKKLKLSDAVNIYMEAFKNTKIGIEIMFSSTHRAFNDLGFLIRYYTNRPRECSKQLKQLIKLLDENTTVEGVLERPYLGTPGKVVYRFVNFKLSQEIIDKIQAEYTALTSTIRRFGSEPVK